LTFEEALMAQLEEVSDRLAQMAGAILAADERLPTGTEEEEMVVLSRSIWRKLVAHAAWAEREV
jgi:heme-degrading monooxygenase HmoA